MNAVDDSQQRQLSPIAGHTGYVLGSALRHTVNFMLFPYWSLGKHAALLASARIREWSRRRAGSQKPAECPEALPEFAAARAREDGPSGVAHALVDPDPAVRLSAVHTIGEFSADRAAAFVADLLHDPEPEIRRAVADAAAHAGSSTSVFALLLALGDPNPDVRAAVKRAIETISGEALDVDVSEPVGQVKLQELKRWWKAERLWLLATQAKQ